MASHLAAHLAVFMPGHAFMLHGPALMRRVELGAADCAIVVGIELVEARGLARGAVGGVELAVLVDVHAGPRGIRSGLRFGAGHAAVAVGIHLGAGAVGGLGEQRGRAHREDCRTGGQGQFLHSDLHGKCRTGRTEPLQNWGETARRIEGEGRGLRARTTARGF